MTKPTCSVDGCEKPRSAKGYCPMHYQRWKRHGDPLVLKPVPVRGEHYVDDDEPLTCKKCGTTKPASEFTPVKVNRNGRSGSCKRCWADDAIERWRNSPEVQAHQYAYRLEYFRANPEVRRAQTARYYARHREAIRTRARAWEKANAAKRRAARAEYRARPECVRAAAARSKAWREANPERARILARSTRTRRTAAERAATMVPFSSAQLEARLAYWGHRCWMCGGGFQHIDHVKPISRGGAHMLANLRPACAPCNLAKNRKWNGPAWTATLVVSN